MTAYDASVEAAKEVYRKEERERELAEFLEREKETFKPAARIWFNLLTELWPPENTERYWEKTNGRLNAVYNENRNNKLLHELLMMTHEYLWEIVYGKSD